MRIVHMWDLYFGADRSCEEIQERACRDSYLLDVLEGLTKMTQKQPVDLILLTQAVEFRGEAQRLALKLWLEQVAQACGVSLQRILILPTEDRSKEMGFLIHEICPGSSGIADCVSTLYQFGGGRWRRSREGCKIQLGKKKEGALWYGLSLLWWMRISD